MQTWFYDRNIRKKIQNKKENPEIYERKSQLKFLTCDSLSLFPYLLVLKTLSSLFPHLQKLWYNLHNIKITVVTILSVQFIDINTFTMLYHHLQNFFPSSKTKTLYSLNNNVTDVFLFTQNRHSG